MLRGRFDHSREGRPYVDAIAWLPRFPTRGLVSFLVDTGADRTTISPSDALLLKVPYDELDEGSARFASGVGGSSQVFGEPSVVVFLDPRNAMFAYQMEVGIIDDSHQARELPSLLGRDILDRWRMTYCPVDNLLSFEVLSADAML